jgi:hypothetical protein
MIRFRRLPSDPPLGNKSSQENISVNYFQTERSEQKNFQLEFMYMILDGKILAIAMILTRCTFMTTIVIATIYRCFKRKSVGHRNFRKQCNCKTIVQRCDRK